MQSQAQPTPDGGPAAPPPDAAPVAASPIPAAMRVSLTRLVEALRSVSLGIGLMIVIGAHTALGTVIIQNKPAAFYAQRYGEALGGFILALGYDDIFHGAIFQYLLVLFAINMLLATVTRPLTLRHLGLHVSHLSIALIMLAGVYGSLFGTMGFIRLREGQMTDRFIDSRGLASVSLGFAVLVEAFDILYNPPQAFLHLIDGNGKSVGSVEVRGPGTYRMVGRPATFEVTEADLPPAPPDDSTMGSTPPGDMRVSFTVRQRGADDQNYRFVDIRGQDRAGIKLGNDTLMVLLENRPFLKDYVARLAVVEPAADGTSRVLKREHVEVNNPLEHEGFMFYQSSFERDRQGRPTITILQATADPGLHAAYVGLTALVLGILWAFTVKPYLSPDTLARPIPFVHRLPWPAPLPPRP